MSLEQLTQLQKVAVEGEVAYIVSTAAHDAEIKMRIYFVLKEVEDMFKPFLYEAFKEAVTFDPEIVDRIYMETKTDTVPVWLWKEKAIADIKESLLLADTGMLSPKISVDKLYVRRRIVESAFIAFARKAALASPSSCLDLLETMESDYMFDFMSNSIFYLKSTCEELQITEGIETSISEKILECFYDIREFLNIRVETKALDVAERMAQDRVKQNMMSTLTPTENGFVVSLNSDMSPQEVTELINNKLSELFSSVTKPKTPQVKYVVKKVFNNSNLTTDIRTCTTEKEAKEFIAKIKEEYPELMSTCDFVVCREKVNGKRKRA